MKSEAPIKDKVYRERHGIGVSLMCAIKRAMQLPRNSKFVVESQVNQWRAAHPEFRQTDIYKRKTVSTDK